LVTDSHTILVGWRNHFSQLFNVHGVNDVRQRKIHTEYAIRRVRVKQDDLKLNGTHQHLVYGDDVNVLGRSVLTVKKITQA